MKYFMVFTAIIFFVSCKTDEAYKTTDFIKGDAFFSIKIDNPNNSYIKVRGFGISDHIVVGENNYFMDTIKNSTEGYYTFSDRMHACGFYIKPNSKVYVELNTKDFIRTIKFYGDNIKENNYLRDFFLLTRDLGRKISIQYLAYLNEKDYIFLLDSIKNIRLDLLKKHDKKSHLDKHFFYLEKERLFYEFASRMETYESYRQYAIQDTTFRVSSAFFNYRKQVEFENENLIVVPSYRYFLENYYQKKANKNVEKDTSDAYVSYLKVIGKEVKNKRIKERLLYSYAIQNLADTGNKTDFFKTYKKYAKNSYFVNDISVRFRKLNRLTPGKVAPAFQFYDVDEKLVKLSDFKGRYVYVDIWATWCSDCVMQMPYLDKLKNKYKDDIVFIAVSTDDFKGTWKKFLKKNNVNGIQLYAGSDETFKDLYKVQSIPKFILINPDGNISTANAPKPSETELVEMLFDKIATWNKKNETY